MKKQTYLKCDSNILAVGELNSTEKLILCLIISLSIKEGYCWAKNETFSKILGISEKTVTRCLNSLVARKYVIREVSIRNERKLTITKKTEDVQDDSIDKLSIEHRQVVHNSHASCLPPIDKLSKSYRQHVTGINISNKDINKDTNNTINNSILRNSRILEITEEKEIATVTEEQTVLSSSGSEATAATHEDVRPRPDSEIDINELIKELETTKTIIQDDKFDSFKKFSTVHEMNMLERKIFEEKQKTKGEPQ